MAREYSASAAGSSRSGIPAVQGAAICAEYPDDANAASARLGPVVQLQRRNEEKDNFRAFRETDCFPAGLIGALFGRMVTSDPGANIDAAIHVAHAFTVHAEESESDYFSVWTTSATDEDDQAQRISATWS